MRIRPQGPNRFHAAMLASVGFLFSNHVLAEARAVVLLPAEFLDVETSSFDPQTARHFHEASERGVAQSDCALADPSSLASASADLGVDLAMCRDAACMEKVRTACNAKAILRVEVEQEGALYTFRIRLAPGDAGIEQRFSGTRSQALLDIENLVSRFLSEHLAPSAPRPAPPEPARPAEPPPPPEPVGPGWQTILGYTLIGVGGAALVPGAVFIALDGSCRHEGCDDNTTDPTVERWDSALAGGLLLGLGAAAVGTGLFLVLFEDEENASVVLAPCPAGPGLAAVGRF